MRLTICDVIVRPREVEVPDVCPRCDVALDQFLHRGWEYREQSRPVRIDAQGQIENDDDAQATTIPEGGEGFIGYVAISCGLCGQIIAEGNVERPASTVA
jgi:hypothetical protein